jgi:glycerol-3-phosphate responsive antiterminator
MRFVMIDDLPKTKVNFSDFVKHDLLLCITQLEIENYLNNLMLSTDILLLDNDLGYGIEGREYLSKYIKHNNFPKIVIITSRNSVARKYMLQLLIDNGYIWKTEFKSEHLLLIKESRYY